MIALRAADSSGITFAYSKENQMRVRVGSKTHKIFFTGTGIQHRPDGEMFLIFIPGTKR